MNEIADELADEAPLQAVEDENLIALRWRRAILKLSSAFVSAAGARSDLSPILLEAMHNALENLLVYGDAADLLALEEWLDQEQEDSRQAPGLRETGTPQEC